ncbi:MAG: hypothetical protein ACOY32_10685 [Thermodesulfobacteriota bacterium]
MIRLMTSSVFIIGKSGGEKKIKNGGRSLVLAPLFLRGESDGDFLSGMAVAKSMWQAMRGQMQEWWGERQKKFTSGRDHNILWEKSSL